jgi:hypothetical protein
MGHGPRTLLLTTSDTAAISPDGGDHGLPRAGDGAGQERLALAWFARYVEEDCASATLSSRGVSAGHLNDGLDLHGEPERQCGHPDGGPGRPTDAVAEGTDQ